MTAPDDALAAFVGKWQAREPEMRIATVFWPAARRPVALAWGALLHELREAAFEMSDPGVAAAKCAWWAEELHGWGERRSRHPLGRVLSAVTAPWAALGAAWLEWPDVEDRPGSTKDAMTSLMPAARAVDAVEAALLGTPAPLRIDQAPVIACHWLLHRLPHGLAAVDRARVPMHLVARHGGEALGSPGPAQTGLLADWAGELLSVESFQPTADSAFRRCRTAFDRARLARLARGQAGPPSPVATLLSAWRAARAG
jgi:hypothetical protein